jgi:hypothetical protein
MDARRCIGLAGSASLALAVLLMALALAGAL